MINFDKLFTEHGYARFTPALNDKYAYFGADPATKHKARLPATIRPQDFDPFNEKSRLFYYPNVLYSGIFGVSSDKNDVLRKNAGGYGLRIADSGGFSFIANPKFSEVSWRAALLQWQEAYFDIGIVLDIPTRAIGVPGNGYDSFDMCLHRTLDNLKFARDHQTSTRTCLLSVYQGRNVDEAKSWLKAVEPYPLQGLAIAGDTRLDIAFWVRNIIDMIDRGKFDHVRHIHVLGTTQLTVAVLLTALQRALRKCTGREIAITFDSSLAFSIAQKYGRMSTYLKGGKNGLTIGEHSMPWYPGEFEPDAPFPYASPLADQCRMRDFLPRTVPAEPAMDHVGAQMLSNHTLCMDLWSIVQANRLVDMGQTSDKSPIAPSLRQAVRLIHEAFSGTDTGKHLRGLRDQQAALAIAAEPVERSGDSNAVFGG